MTKKAYFIDNGEGYSDWNVYGVIIVDTTEVTREMLEGGRKEVDKQSKVLFDAWYSGTDEYKVEHGYPNIMPVFKQVLSDRGIHCEAYSADEYISMT